MQGVSASVDHEGVSHAPLENGPLGQVPGRVAGCPGPCWNGMQRLGNFGTAFDCQVTTHLHSHTSHTYILTLPHTLTRHTHHLRPLAL